MRCPRCGRQLRRSPKDPAYGLCDNCRRKFTWVDEYGGQPQYRRSAENSYGNRYGYEEDNASRASARRASARRDYDMEQEYDVRSRGRDQGVDLDAARHELSRFVNRGGRYSLIRLAAGAVSVLLFILMIFQSCGARDSANPYGIRGYLAAILLLAAGAATVYFRQMKDVPSYAIPAGIYLLSAVLAAFKPGMLLWAFLAAVLAALHILLLFLCNRFDNALLTFAVPIAIILLILIVSVVTAVADGKSRKAEKEKEVQEPKQTVTEPEEPAEQGPINFDGSGYNVTYLRHEASTDADGNPCLFYYYTFTNTGEENLTPMNATYVKAFQNGLECNAATAVDASESRENYMKEVEPGASVEVCQVFSLTDETDVTIEVSDYVEVDEKKATQILKLGAGDGTDAGDAASGDTASGEEASDSGADAGAEGSSEE